MISIKYTRYDLKKKKESNFLFIVIIITIILLAFILGSIFFKVFVKESSKDKVENGDNKISEQQKGIITKEKDEKFVAIQGGIFKNKDNLENNKNKLSYFGTPFYIEEERGTRVFLGIYEEKEGDLIGKKLKEKNIDNSKMNFAIKIRNQCDAEISEIIKVYTRILSKLNERGTKAINLKEFKNWCANIEDSNKKCGNLKIKKELKEHINKLPNELHKENVNKEYIFIYNILKKLS